MNVRKQQGLSIIGFILVLAMIVFVVFIGMRLWPIYYNHFSVVNAMNSVAEQRGSANMPLFTIRTRVYNNLFVSGTEGFIHDNNITKVRGGGVYLRIAYEVRRPLIGNLDVIATFDRKVKLQN